MRKVHKRELKPGMVLAKTLASADSNNIILERGAILNDRKIESLQKYDLNSIYILGQLNLTENELATIDESINKVVNEAEKEAKDKGEYFDRISFLNAYLDANKIVIEYSFDKNASKISDDKYMKGLVFKNVFEVDIDSVQQPFNMRHQRLFSKTKLIFDAIQRGEAIKTEELNEPLKRAIIDIQKNDNVMSRLHYLEANDSYTFDHSMRVLLLSITLGKWLGYTEGDLEKLSLSSLFFDLGKMKIPEFIIGRQQKLGTKEYEMIKRHPEFGYSILKGDKDISEDVLQGILLHHERMDGSGYPFKLKGKKIHEFARIIGICDTFDALTSERSYARRRTVLEGIDELEYMAVKLFDTEMVYILSNKLSDYYVGNRVMLNSGRQGEIIYINPKWPTKPVIRVSNEVIDLKVQNDLQIIKMQYA